MDDWRGTLSGRLCGSAFAGWPGESGVAGLGRVGIIGGETDWKWERVKRKTIAGSPLNERTAGSIRYQIEAADKRKNERFRK